MLASNSKNLEIAIIGAGNVAFNLTQSLLEAGYSIIQVYGRTQQNAQELASLAGCDYTTTVNDITTNAHLYILAIPDAAIGELARNNIRVSGVVVHTSGSTSMSALSPIADRFGVFYPFQTFTKGRKVNLQDVPFCIEASDDNVKSFLAALAKSLGGKPFEMDSETRQWLHLSGVFSCNFVNHMLAIGQILAQEKGFDFNLLKPLINETINKAMEGNPLISQTGPAIRGDSDTIKKHVALLSTIDDDIRDLYMAISTNILNLK